MFELGHPPSTQNQLITGEVEDLHYRVMLFRNLTSLPTHSLIHMSLTYDDIGLTSIKGCACQHNEVNYVGLNSVIVFYVRKGLKFQRWNFLFIQMED